VIVGALATVVLLPMVGLGGRRRMQSDGAGDGPLRPLAKAAIRGYITVADKAKEWAAETRESWGELVAEVRAERETARNRPQPESSPAQPEAAQASGEGSGRPSRHGRQARHSAARRTSRP
jgi:hypothetical protein